MTYQEYGPLLIEARDRVNAASRVLPDCPLKKEFEAAMEAYTDANSAWGAKVEGRRLFTHLEPGMTLIPKYPSNRAGLRLWLF